MKWNEDEVEYQKDKNVIENGRKKGIEISNTGEENCQNDMKSRKRKGKMNVFWVTTKREFIYKGERERESVRELSILIMNG